MTDRKPDPTKVAPLVDACGRIIAGEHPSIQGAVIADLLAIFLAGHINPLDAEDTRAQREAQLDLIVSTACDLVPVNARGMGLPH